jgi:hypothetical protein
MQVETNANRYFRIKLKMLIIFNKINIIFINSATHLVRPVRKFKTYIYFLMIL